MNLYTLEYLAMISSNRTDQSVPYVEVSADWRTLRIAKFHFHF